MNTMLTLVKCGALIFLDIPYYISKGLEDMFGYVADVWPPFTEFAKEIWRKR